MGKKEFHSNGKLLLTGEYLVLQGALALAAPVRFGQHFSLEDFNDEHPMIHWRTWIKDELWFEAEFSTPYFKILSTTDADVANKLSEYFIAMAVLNPNFIDSTKYYQANSRLDFNIDWGLGSSSSLISNLAHWAGLNPYQLHEEVTTGSGYDIAAARSENPILYRKKNDEPEVEEVDFNPPFRTKLFFAYSGKKQNSAESVEQYLKSGKEGIQDKIDEVDEITRRMIDCKDFAEFNDLIASHEKIIAGILKKKPVKQSGFSDFDGQVKSLGAWGGDFLLFTWEKSRKELETHLDKKGIQHIFSFDELIKTNR